MISTLFFRDTFLISGATISGPREKEGPLGMYIDFSFDDITAGKDSYEKAESKMIDEAISLALQKAMLQADEIDLCIGGDLTSQISSSNDAVKNMPYSFLGVYGACSTSMLSLGIASCMVSAGFAKNALAFASSNYGSAERQFRYPLEYGVKKKETATTTVTGAGAGIVSRRQSKVEIVAATFGKVVDVEWDDPNNMGAAMAYAAYDTLLTHFRNTKTESREYDLILSGDLSQVGSGILADLFEESGQHLTNYADSGNLIYDPRRQKDVYAGGSGCACLAITAYSFVIDKMVRRELNNVLLVGTGCLHSKISSAQKQTIPVIAHAVQLRRVK